MEKQIENQNAAVAVIEPKKEQIAMGGKGFQLKTLDDAWRFSQAVAKSGLAPKGIETPEAIVTCIQFGFELGLTPMAALQSIAVINGRPSIYGDTALGLCRQSGKLESYKQAYSGEGDTRKCTVTVKRTGEDAIEASFSVADAKKASLWGKAGPWSQYPERMLLFRARGFALRDAFGDVLKGLRTVEENRDIPIEVVQVAPTLTGGHAALPAAATTVETAPKPKKPEPVTADAKGSEASEGDSGELSDADKAGILAKESSAGVPADSLLAKLVGMLDEEMVKPEEHQDFMQAAHDAGVIRKVQSFDSITEDSAPKLINAFPKIMAKLAEIREKKGE